MRKEENLIYNHRCSSS